MADAYTILQQAVTPPAAPEPLYWGMPLTLMLGLCTLTGVAITALFAAISKKWRTPADDREDKRFGLEADERLLKRFEDMLKERDDELKELRAEIKEVRELAEAASNDNRVLIDWIYAAVRVVRDLGGIDKLPRPPKGVHIVDHPSNQEQEAAT